LTVVLGRVGRLHQFDLDDRELLLDVVGPDHGDHSGSRQCGMVDDVADLEIRVELERAQGPSSRVTIWHGGTLPCDDPETFTILFVERV
jgi:Fe2+ or Zn2+ uptake regulation protein